MGALLPHTVDCGGLSPGSGPQLCQSPLRARDTREGKLAGAASSHSRRVLRGDFGLSVASAYSQLI